MKPHSKGESDTENVFQNDRVIREIPLMFTPLRGFYSDTMNEIVFEITFMIDRAIVIFFFPCRHRRCLILQ